MLVYRLLWRPEDQRQPSGVSQTQGRVAHAPAPVKEEGYGIAMLTLLSDLTMAAKPFFLFCSFFLWGENVTDNKKNKTRKKKGRKEEGKNRKGSERSRGKQVAQ